MIVRYPAHSSPPQSRDTQLYQSAAKIGIYEPPSRISYRLGEGGIGDTFSARLEPRECLQLVDAHDWRSNQ